MSEDREIATATFNLDTPKTRSVVLSGICLQTGILWFSVSLAFVAFGMYFQNSVFPQSERAFTLAAFTIAPLYFALSFAFSGYRTWLRLTKRFKDRSGAGLYRAWFSIDKFRFESEAGVINVYPYSVVSKLSPEAGGILIVIDFRALWVPREAFTSEEDFDLASKRCLSAQLAKSAQK